MNNEINNPKDIARQLKASLKEILKRSDHFYSSLKDIALDDDQSLKQKMNAAEQLLKSSQEKWLTHIMMEEKCLFPFLRLKMPKVKATIYSLKEKCKTIMVNFEVAQYLCWELTSRGSGLKRSAVLNELKTNGKKLVAIIDSYLNLETEYMRNLMIQIQNEQSELKNSFNV